MRSKSLDGFLELLEKSPSGAVFNPWWDVDNQNDIGRDAPAIRRKQLRAYLHKRLRNAKLAVIGEAIGYRGGHFSGIPMTSERLLLGKARVVAALYERRNVTDGGRPSTHGFAVASRPPLKIIHGIEARRTSKPSLCPDGFSEPTATIVWGTLLRLGLDPEQFVLWNAFPWHSFDPRRGMLSNRTPTGAERAAGLPVLRTFLELFRCEQVVPLGKIAAAQLQELDVHANYVRHPASGGAKLFRQQIAKIVR